MSAIDPNFENLRQTLINTYNSQTTNHVTAVVAITVGIFILISTKDFQKLHKKHRIWFLFALSLPFSLIEYFAEKMLFWAWMSSEVLTVTEQQAINTHQSTVIYGIQAYLICYFKNNVHTVSSILYQLDQKQFGTSFVLLFALTYVIFGFCYEFYLTRHYKWYNKNYKLHYELYKWYDKNKLWYVISKKWDLILGIIPIIVILIYFNSLISIWIFFEFQWLFIWILGLFIWLLSEFYSIF